MNNKIFISLVLLLIFSQSMFAKGIGTTMFQILQMPTNAYDASLANTISSNEISSISNPSLIPFLSRSIILSHSIYLQDTKYSIGDINIPLNETSGLNFSFCYFDMGSMNRTIESTDGYSNIGSFNANDKVFNMSYGQKICRSFSAGISLKYINQTIDDVSYSGFATNISGLYFLSDKSYLNAGINNLGPNVKGYSLPTDLYCSLTGPLGDNSIGILQVNDYYNDDIIELKAAVETTFNNIFALRFGYVLPNRQYGGTNNSFFTNLTLGVGLKLKGFFVDYAWLPKGDLGNIHMFTIRVNF